MYRFSQIFKRDLLNLIVNPMWFFNGTLFPFLLVLILGFLSSGNYGTSVTSYDYYGVTMMIYVIFNASTISANSFMEERIKQGNMRIIYSPVPKSFLYSSKILASFVFSAICHLLVILVLKLTLNVNFGGDNILFVNLVLLLFEFFASTLGVMFCCIFKSENTTNQILSIVINIAAVLGGLFFQLDGLGKNVAKISYISPVKWIVTDIFKVIYDNDFSYYLPAAIALIVLSMVGLIICGKVYRTEDYI